MKGNNEMKQVESQTSSVLINLDNVFSIGIYTSEGDQVERNSEVSDSNDYSVWVLSETPINGSTDDNSLTGHLVYRGSYQDCVNYLNSLRLVTHQIYNQHDEDWQVLI